MHERAVKVVALFGSTQAFSGHPVGPSRIVADNEGEHRPRSAHRDWRETEPGSIARQLALGLIVVGGVATVAWTAFLAYVAYRVLIAYVS